MLFALATAAALPAIVLSNKAPLGVSPHSAALYAPIISTTPATWKCLDGSQTILYSAVNDDYCDCIDGSDEPG
jgi:protein kinase C substrate 80K-H